MSTVYKAAVRLAKEARYSGKNSKKRIDWLVANIAATLKRIKTNENMFQVQRSKTTF